MHMDDGYEVTFMVCTDLVTFQGHPRSMTSVDVLRRF